MPKIFVSLLRRAAIFCFALAVFNLPSATVLGADERTETIPTGELTIAGGAHVDDVPAISGQTVFNGSTFRVAAASHSTITLGNHTRLELSAETILKLDFSKDQVAGVLKAGRVRVFAPAGVRARLITEDATTLTDSRQPSVFSVESGRDGGTTISVETGQVEMSEGNRRQLVCAGEFLSTAAVSSDTVVNARQHMSGGTKAGLALGIAGVIAIITLIFTGRSKEESLSFGGCVPGSPGASPMSNSCL
jgi:hypothetical protein